MSTKNYELWKGDLTESQVLKRQEAARKSFNKNLLLTFIPIVSIVGVGRAIYCYNSYIFIKTKGRGKGNALIRFWLGISSIANLFIPTIVAKSLENNPEKGEKILGFDKL